MAMTAPTLPSTGPIAPRLGGELPAGADGALTAPWALPADVLAFSHDRAALSWLHAARGPFRSALHAAYTCPSVPENIIEINTHGDVGLIHD